MAPDHGDADVRNTVKFTAILLGAFVLGIVAVGGWTSLVSRAVDLSDRMRRANCTWADPLVVSVGGQALSVEAGPATTLTTRTGWIGGEEVTGYRQAPVRYGFCLDAPPEGSLAVQAVTIGGKRAADLARRAGLPEVAGPVVEIADAALFLPDAPPETGVGPDMTVYFRNVDYGWPRMVAQAVDREGFRLGALCRDGEGEAWLCEVSALDTRTGLSYRFGPLSLETAGFDAAPPPALFGAVARGMRAVVALLSAESVAQR